MIEVKQTEAAALLSVSVRTLAEKLRKFPQARLARDGGRVNVDIEVLHALLAAEDPIRYGGAAIKEELQKLRKQQEVYAAEGAEAAELRDAQAAAIAEPSAVRSPLKEAPSAAITEVAVGEPAVQAELNQIRVGVAALVKRSSSDSDLAIIQRQHAARLAKVERGWQNRLIRSEAAARRRMVRGGAIAAVILTAVGGLAIWLAGRYDMAEALAAERSVQIAGLEVTREELTERAGRIEGRLVVAMDEAARLAQLHSEAMADQVTATTEARTEAARLTAELTAARERATMLEDSLTLTRQRLSDLEKTLTVETAKMRAVNDLDTGSAQQYDPQRKNQ